MTREKENYNAFLLHFLERLNGCESIENKITESLTDICEYYGFKRGFIYQTDGFRYFYLKETVGNSDNILRQRFEISEMTNQHVVRANGKNKPFYACRNQNTSCAGMEKRGNYFWWQESGWKRIQSVRLGVSGKRFWKSRGFVRC